MKERTGRDYKREGRLRVTIQAEHGREQPV
jgi:hypothetical protein